MSNDIFNGKFSLGQVVSTTSVREKINSDSNFYMFCLDSLCRHVECDWGDVCDEDKHTNDESLAQGERLLSAYTYPMDGTKIWIITERDRSATTILYPSEY